MSVRNRIVAVLATVATVGGGAAVFASPAAAADRNGKCDSGEFCYYFNSDNQGSVSDFSESVPDYGTSQPSCYEFKSDGKGKGQCVKNQAASVFNNSDKTVRVYYNSNYDDSRYAQDIKPGAKVNLNSHLKNQNASHEFIANNGGGGGGCHTDGTDTKLPSSILVYRVASKKVERVDFKTYVKNVLPNEWITSWPAESLKAGAMAVKNFGWYWALHSTRKAGGACFDVYDSTSSQVYKPGSATASTNSAVDATWGSRMTRGGDIFEAHYCSTSTACGAWQDGYWMSQYGSRDLANSGSSWKSIVKHYYTGIALT